MSIVDDIFLVYQRVFFKNEKKRKIWISARQIGKSFALAGILSFKALTSQSKLSLCISTGARAASEIIRKVAQFAEAIKTVSDGQIDYSQSFDCVKFSNGARVMSLPSSTDGSNLRGWTAGCVCIDEAAFIPNLEQILQAIGPTISRDRNAELIMATTPAGKQGFFYDTYLRALDDQGWYVQTTTIDDAVADGLKVDIEQLHSLCPDREVYDQEYMCKFASEYSSFLDDELLVFEDNPSQPVVASFLGGDIGAKHDRTAFVDVALLQDGTYFVRDAAVLHKADYQHQLDVLKELHQKNKWSAGYIDANGLGGPIAEFANKQVSARIVGFTWTAQNKTKAYENVRALAFDRKLVFASHLKNMVKTDVQNVSRIVSESGTVRYEAGRDSEGHSDVVSAIVLGVQAGKDNPVNFCGPQTYVRQSPLGGWSSRL